MKKLLFFAPFAIAMLIFPCLVLAQTPPEEADQPVMDELNTAVTRAEETRKKAGDFESPSYFPGEWEAAEAQYTNAGSAQTPAAYNAAADAFDAVFKLTIPLYAQAREDEIMALRNNLVAGGVRDSFPEIFALADTTALSALEQYEAQDYYTARDSAAKALLMYQAITSAYSAWLAQQEIKGRKFESYDSDNFSRAGEILNEATEAFKAGNFSLVREKADEALLRYNLVLSAGWAAYAELRFSLAETERKAALDIKANIAARDLFAEAEANYKTSVVSYDSQKYEEAAKQFINSEALFIAASASASEKRLYAEVVIKEARERIEKSSEAARQAEITIQGRSK
ncbi:MAG: hypothetical protein LBH20_07980 [Treponema sp.]|jgi:hypothetical protein|nr:hypothetical protein [Treponema sp.]